MGNAHTILALDLGTKTGFGVCRNGELLESGEKDFASKEGYKDLVYLRFWNWLQELHAKHEINEIVFERVMAHGGGKRANGSPIFNVAAAHTYGGFLALMMVFAGGGSVTGGRIPVVGLHVATIKKQFTGSGKATKEEICQKAHQLGWMRGKIGTKLHDNEADAIAMLYVLLAERGVVMVIKG